MMKLQIDSIRPVKLSACGENVSLKNASLGLRNDPVRDVPRFPPPRRSSFRLKRWPVNCPRFIKYRFLDGVLPIWAERFEDRDLQPRSVTAPSGDGFMRMPFVLGGIAPGFSPVILNLLRKPGESLISMKGYGMGMSFGMMSLFCLPTRKPAFRHAAVVMPPIRSGRVCR